MGEKLTHRSLFALAICIGCSTSPNVAEPWYGSECVVTVHPENLDSPMMGLELDHDLGASPESSRLTLDMYSYDQPFTLGEWEITTHRKYQLIITYDETGAARLYVRDTLTGDGDYLVIKEYVDSTAPEYSSVAVITDYEEGVGTWIHIVIGSVSDRGVSVLAKVV